MSLRSNLAHHLGFRKLEAPETLPSGLRGLNLVRGAITEICGPASSGRTSLALSVLAEATARQEICALVDAGDHFDPVSAAGNGVDLTRLLWVRCGGNFEHALKAADMLVQAGGFGVIVLDIAGVRPDLARRVPLASWFRLRRAVEPTQTVLLVIEQQANASTCASTILDLQKSRVRWSGKLLHATESQVLHRKPAGSACLRMENRAVG